MLKTANGKIIDTDGPHASRFLRRQAVVDVTGVPVSTIYEMMSRGEFPRPVRISRRLVAWLEHEIIAWQKERVAERDEGSPQVGA